MIAQCRSLLDWYEAFQYARGLPWRRPSEPVARVVLVEGLLAQTRADVVAGQYAGIFAGIQRGDHWLRLAPEERHARVAPLGLPELKLAALDSLATCLDRADASPPPRPVVRPPDRSAPLVEALAKLPGIGPYTAGMVALLVGEPAVPVDANVARVGARCAADGDAPRWMAALVAEALERQAGYPLVSAVLDVGAMLCTARARRCADCPLRPFCATAATGYQALLPLDGEEEVIP